MSKKPELKAGDELHFDAETGEIICQLANEEDAHQRTIAKLSVECGKIRSKMWKVIYDKFPETAMFDTTLVWKDLSTSYLKVVRKRQQP